MISYLQARVHLHEVEVLRLHVHDELNRARRLIAHSMRSTHGSLANVLVELRRQTCSAETYAASRCNSFLAEARLLQYAGGTPQADLQRRIICGQQMQQL
jgi:hypothetical protein